MKLLGISINHDTGVCVYDGEFVAASEERYNRKKFTFEFPKKSLLEISKKLKYSINDFDKIVVAGQYTPSIGIILAKKLFPKSVYKNPFNLILNLYVFFQTFLQKTGLSFIETKILRYYFTKRLNVDTKKLYFVDHHKAHAASAYFPSGFNESLIITLDMMGDALSTTVSIGKNGHIKTIFEQNANNGVGIFYSKITHILGFKASRHEGKITGLAAFGRIKPKILKVIKSIFHFDSSTGGFNYVNFLNLYKSHIVYKKLKKFSKKDVAATAQFYFEEEISQYVNYWFNKTHSKNLCLAGGIFANVKLNQRIHKDVKNIFIFPHMGDGGLAFGAVCQNIKKNFSMENAFLGMDYKIDIDKLDLYKKFNISKPRNVENEIAKLLAQGKVIGRYEGRTEYGPRALGNRSILYQANDPSVQKWLNDKLKRTEFMPFAPAILEDYAKLSFTDLSGAEKTAEFMNIAFHCTDYFKKKCPAAVHIDGTARPQIITKLGNPKFYKIIKHYYNITQIPAIINTSFNMHEEPIVNTPREAIKAFEQANLDYLVLGDFIINKKQ